MGREMENTAPGLSILGPDTIGALFGLDAATCPSFFPGREYLVSHNVADRFP